MPQACNHPEITPLATALQQFAITSKVDGHKGPISALLAINRQALEQQQQGTLSWPLNPDDWKTEKQGQVKGLGLAATQKVLEDYAITRVLAKEAGRTSRGSMQLMLDYIALLNAHHASYGHVDLLECEKTWVRKAQDFFAQQPFILAIDPKWGIRQAIRQLLAQASARQADGSGTKYVGTLMQHMVGAKLEVLLGRGTVSHHNANQNDAALPRSGDFDLADTTIHVTNAPSEALVQKCITNLKGGIKPVVITSHNGSVAFEMLLGNIQDGAYNGRVDVFEFEQFLAANVMEIGKFTAEGRRNTLNNIVQAYNHISLLITFNEK